MRMYASIIMAGVLSVGLVSERGRGEIIQVHGCAPGWIEMGSGDNRWCLADPSWTTPDDGGWGGGGGEDGGGGGGGGGGGTDPVPEDGWDDVDWDEAVRKWRCSQCKVNANKCLAQAQLAETTCKVNSKAQAAWRCDIWGRKIKDGTNTVTSWGCSIDTLQQGLCAAAQSPWDQPWRWNWECSGKGGKGECTGPGVYNCGQSWAESHPEGSKQVVDSGTLSATFGGIGGSASHTITATYNLTPQTGYLAACAAAGNSLLSGCTSQQDACYATYSCTAVDLP